ACLKSTKDINKNSMKKPVDHIKSLMVPATREFLFASSLTTFCASPAAESASRSPSFGEPGGNWVMFLREPKIPFSDSSNPRASGLLQKEGETLDTLTTKSKESKKQSI